ncbi:MAG: NAD-binding protein [Oscillospiraceae bacterium]
MSITVVEANRSRCDELCDLIPEANVIFGDATRSEVLLEEGIVSCDAFVALTGDDGDNIITSMYAKHMDVGKIVVKVNRGY